MIYDPDTDTVTVSRKEYDQLEDRVFRMRESMKRIIAKKECTDGNYFFEWVIDAAEVALQVDDHLKQ